MAKLKAPEGCTSASFNGEVFEADKNGIVEVPEEAVVALLDHGFTTPKAEQAQGGKGSGR
jgi:hypothetical protein